MQALFTPVWFIINAVIVSLFLGSFNLGIQAFSTPRMGGVGSVMLTR